MRQGLFFRGERFIRLFTTSKAGRKEVLSWCFYDFANSAFATTILAVIYNFYYSDVVAGGAQGTLISAFEHTFRVPGATMFTFIIAIAMSIVVLSSPFFGAWADARVAKKRFLALFLFMGVIGTAMLATVGPGDWLKGGLWFIVANIGFAAGNVYYNALLNEIATPDEAGKVSGWGWGIGYIGGGTLLAINLAMLKVPFVLTLPSMGSGNGFTGYTASFPLFTVQHTFLSVSIWWLLFSIPLLLNVRERMPRATAGYMESARDAIHRLSTTLRHLGHYKEMARFLIAYLFFSEGIETVIRMASIFGGQELGMDAGQLVMFFLMIQFTAFFGSTLFGKLTEWMGNKWSLVLTLVIWCGVVVAAYFIGWSGHPIREYYALGVVVGMVMGASQSVARGLLSTFVPQGHEAEFFSFFAVGGKLSTIMGPLVYGLVVWVTGSLRVGIVSLVFFFVVGIILLVKVDERKGRHAAQTTLDTDAVAENG